MKWQDKLFVFTIFLIGCGLFLITKNGYGLTVFIVTGIICVWYIADYFSLESEKNKKPKAE